MFPVICELRKEFENPVTNTYSKSMVIVQN